ncbi:hypothetical protein WN944_027006 [Citrus x changshan-huyou]|uniref:Uncharacterized protein n=1 Tax=Citrus x changshan-huyou TaxID=2935761 RepID=A0AAP0LJ64_9ROSI
MMMNNQNPLLDHFKLQNPNQNCHLIQQLQQAHNNYNNNKNWMKHHEAKWELTKIPICIRLMIISLLSSIHNTREIREVMEKPAGMSKLTKLVQALEPCMERAVRSKAKAASSAVSKVPSQCPSLVAGSLISAAYLLHGLLLTPKNLISSCCIWFCCCCCCFYYFLLVFADEGTDHDELVLKLLKF